MVEPYQMAEFVLHYGLHRDLAIEALAGFDQRADVLRALAHYVVDRES